MKEKRTYWTDAEKRLVSEHYRSKGAEWLAERLLADFDSVRTPAAIARMALKLGAGKKKLFNASEDLKATIRRMHAEGFPDPDIAAETGCTSRQIGWVRRSMGIKGHRPGSLKISRDRSREGLKRWLKARGISSPAYIRVEKWKAWARKLGWPDHLRPRQICFLHALYEHGPMTRRELCEAMGGEWKGSQGPFFDGGKFGSVLPSLERMGLVERSKRIARDPDTESPVNIYSLPLHVYPKPKKENTEQ